MKKFKSGDKVRVLSNNSSFIETGTVGVVLDTLVDLYIVKFGDFIQLQSDFELEIYNELEVKKGEVVKLRDGRYVVEHYGKLLTFNGDVYKLKDYDNTLRHLGNENYDIMARFVIIKFDLDLKELLNIKNLNQVWERCTPTKELKKGNISFEEFTKRMDKILREVLKNGSSTKE